MSSSVATWVPQALEQLRRAAHEPEPEFSPCTFDGHVDAYRHLSTAKLPAIV